MVSLLLLTHDRYEMTRYCLERLLSKIGDIEYELLVLDNNSTDQRMCSYLPEKVHYIANHSNIGIAAGYNKLLSIAKGDYICFLSNDILLLGDNWLFDLIHYNQEINKSGLTSIHCEGEKGVYMPLLNNNDSFTHVWKNKTGITSGVSLISRQALESVGLFDETLGIYGREREQFARRLSLLGYYNYYIPGQYSVHLGREVNDTSEYKRMKDEALQLSSNRYTESLKEMSKKNNYKL